ncbi:hypothetical protein [Streptomyces lincolnensis]|uniref:hypothetical protein n=1 Tax=Streptomyces lincolnensis TaxID=1915 RepID=UPI0037D9422F
MRRTARIATTLAALSTVIGLTSSSAQADNANAGIYTGWNQVGYCEFRPYGEHLIIKDLDADGHSIVAQLSVEGYGTYYYWNSEGNGTTRDKDLEFAEDHHVTLRCYVGDWKGSPTEGIIWDSYDKMNEFARTWT